MGLIAMPLKSSHARALVEHSLNFVFIIYFAIIAQTHQPSCLLAPGLTT